MQKCRWRFIYIHSVYKFLKNELIREESMYLLNLEGFNKSTIMKEGKCDLQITLHNPHPLHPVLEIGKLVTCCNCYCLIVRCIEKKSRSQKPWPWWHLASHLLRPNLRNFLNVECRLVWIIKIYIQLTKESCSPSSYHHNS